MKNLAKQVWKHYKSLSRSSKIKVSVSSSASFLLSGLDIWALTLLASTLHGTSSQSLMTKAWELAATITLFLLKSLLSAWLTYVVLRQFEEVEIQIGNKNIETSKTLPWSKIRNLSEVDLANLVDKSPYTIAIIYLFAAAMFLSEAITVLAIVLVLLFNNFLSSVAALGFFTFVLIVQNNYLGRLSSRIGLKQYESQTKTHQLTIAIHGLGKLLKVADGSKIFENLKKHREDMVHSRNSMWYVASIPRFLMEAVLALGLSLVAIITLIFSGADSVFPTLSLFAAGAYRLLPTLNRMQGYALWALGAEPYGELDESLLDAQFAPNKEAAEVRSALLDETCLIKLDSVSFRYQGSNTDVLQDISLEFHRGKTYALVGKSGSGKTSFGDLCLGLLSPTKGKIVVKPGTTFAYVPQDTTLLDGTLEENITLGESARDLELRQAISNAELSGIELGPKPVLRLSGGQRQRIGLARAIYARADFTVFDEATSALDNETENKVVNNLNSARARDATMLVIAHRLSTIKTADEIIYLENGRVLGKGSWPMLMKTCAPFNESVRLGEL